MRDFSIAVDIEASPERVWAVMLDIERWAEWTASIRSIERLDGGPLAVGSRARIRQPNVLPAIWEVTALDAGKAFTWITRSPGVTATGRHFVEPAGQGSRATLSLDFGGPLGSIVGWLLRGLNERYLGLEAAGLKGRCEGH
jgi:uncharacterized protein YndB with AHSA1/START domain